MVKLFKQSTTKTKLLALAAIFFVACQGVFEGLQTKMLASIFGVLQENPSNPNQHNFWFWTCFLLGNAVCCLLFGLFGSWLGTKASLLSVETIRHKMFIKTTNLSFIDIDKISTASILTRTTNDVQKYQLALQMILALFIKTPIMFFYGIISGFFKSWLFGLIFVGIMSIIILGFAFITKSVAISTDKAQTQIDNVNVVVRENALGMRIIKSFNLQNQQQERFNYYNTNLCQHNTKAWIVFGLILPLLNTVIHIAIGLVLLLSGYMFLNNQLSDNVNVKFVYEIVNLLMITLMSVILSCSIIVTYIRAIPSCARINELLALEPTIKNDVNCQKLLPNNLDIEFHNVNFKYFDESEKLVLKKINLKIKQGETLGIVGSTGSGKSTLVNLIPRLYDLKETKNSFLKIGGIPIKKIDLNSLQKYVGIVLQEKVLFSGTIKYNLLFGNHNASEKQMMYYAKIACADTIINNKQNKLNAIVDQRGRNFSGGQQQRLCIARTLLKQPKILILDDSTSALDMITESHLQQNIRKELKGITTIIVAQRISSIKNCDHIVVMEAGEIVGYGTHDDLRKNNSIYRSIVISQMGKEGLYK